MSKKRILYLGGFVLPDKNAAAHRVVANAKVMRELGYEVILLGVHDDSEPGQDLLRQNDSYFGFECWSVRYPRTRAAWVRYVLGQEELLRFIKQLPADWLSAVVFYNYPAVAQLRLSAICKARGIKHISDATEWYDSSGGDPIFRLSKWLDTTLRMRYVHRRADAMITTSRYLTDFYADQGYPIAELPTMYDADSMASAPVRQDHPVRKFIYVGTPFIATRVSRSRASVKERLDTCIRLFFDLYKSGETFIFDIYGVSREAYLSVYPYDSAMLDELKDRVIFHGRKPHALILSMLATSDFSIFFRDTTRVTLAGFPSKMAESVTCGTPVVSNMALNMEPLAGNKWIILTDDSNRVERTRELIRLSGQQVHELKSAAFESRFFDYRNYKNTLAGFFEVLYR